MLQFIWKSVNLNKFIRPYSMDVTWLGIQILLVTDTCKKGRGVDQKTSQYLVWPPFALCSTTHLLHIELIRLFIVASGMLSHSSSMAVRNCWILEHTVVHIDPEHPKHAQWVTCLVGMHGRTGTFSASRILATGGRALSRWNLRWWRWINGTRTGLRISSRYLCAFKLPSIKLNCVRCP